MACSTELLQRMNLIIFFMQQNSLTFRILWQISDFLGKLLVFQRSISNSLTFLDFPGQWKLF